MSSTKLRDKLAGRSQAMLPAGSNIRQVFMCQTGPSPYFFLLTYLTLFWIQYRVVCVTDDAIYVLRCGKFAPSRPKEVVGTVSRDQQLGPVSGLWHQVHLLDRRHWVNKRFYKDIDAADRERPQVGPRQ